MHIAPLPDLCLPARVIRRHDMTLLWVDPSTLWAELAFWVRDRLTDAERIALRRAYHQPVDLSVPLDDELLEGQVDARDIPAELLYAPPVRVPVVQLPRMREPEVLVAGD